MTLHLMRAIRRLVLVGALTAACGRSGPSFSEQLLVPDEVSSPANADSAAWISNERIAVTSFVEPADATISIQNLEGTDVDGGVLGSKPNDCVVRSIAGLGRLPNGQLGFAEICSREAATAHSELRAYDPATRKLASMGTTSQRVVSISWAPDMRRALYTAEGSLCATLYDHGPVDGPVATVVSVQGASIPLGEDLSRDPDGCTQRGNATRPAFSPDGESYAVFARATQDRSGQDRIDLPWALLVVRPDGNAKTLLDGLGEATDLAWLSGDVLLFAGTVGGQAGLWEVHADGSGLARLASADVRLIDISPDGSRLLAVAQDSMDIFDTSLLVYDLSGLLEGG